MLDKSIPFYGVLMIKHDTDSYPCYALPEGYKFLGYRNGLEMEWARIEYELGQIDTFEKALEVFRREFPGTEEHLSKHCFFIESPSGDIAAIASLWHGDSFGEDYPRVHWVAVDEKYQGKGLAKALLTKLMDVYHEHGHTLPLYLVTQT
ncbi:MAG: GNAT family N-acetyltransferase, partial [Clostridiales bacterium]|nr:GNAT family N-acetyltransferase [Clostridiales bacterium]